MKYTLDTIQAVLTGESDDDDNELFAFEDMPIGFTYAMMLK